jgi:hypothetical protein
MISSLNESWYAAQYDGARRMLVTVAHKVLPKPQSLTGLARWLLQARS